MSLPPTLSLRDAILARIKLIPAIVAVCGPRVFPVVPTKGPLAALPHVTCGPALRQRGENGADPLGMLRLRLFVCSDEPRPDEAWTLAHAIERALEGEQPEIGGGYRLIDVLRIQQIGDVLDRAGPSEVFIDIATIVEVDE